MFGLPKIIQQLQQSEDDLRKIVLCVERGGRAVGIVMNVLQEVVEVRFRPGARSLLAEDRLGTVLAEAHNQALRETHRQLKEEISRLTGITNLPDLPGIF